MKKSKSFCFFSKFFILKFKKIKKKYYKFLLSFENIYLLLLKCSLYIDKFLSIKYILKPLSMTRLTK